VIQIRLAAPSTDDRLARWWPTHRAHRRRRARRHGRARRRGHQRLVAAPASGHRGARTLPRTGHQAHGREI